MLKAVYLVQNNKKTTMSIEEIPQGADVSILSKNEKKARELIKKLNLKQIKGITRVTFKQRGNLIYAIDQPDVFRSSAGTYVVFGEAKVDDMNKRIAEAQQQQAQQDALSKAAGETGEAWLKKTSPKTPLPLTWKRLLSTPTRLKKKKLMMVKLTNPD